LAVNGKQSQGVTQAVTQSRWRLTVSIEGNDFGVWDKKTGGRVGSNVLMYSPGGMAPQVALTGTKTTDAIQLQRIYDLPRDHDNITALYDAVGGGKCVVKQTPLDKDGNAYGGRGAIVWTGLLQDVSSPDVDSTANTEALVTITIAPNGTPAQS
jgi:hypothetical protein